MNEYLDEKAMFDAFPVKDEGVYVYVRVSTSKQNVAGQIKEVYDWCVKNRLYPKGDNIYIDEAISGKITWKDRKVGEIVAKANKHDTIIVPELSRLGRNMLEINGLINQLVSEKKIIIIDIKNNLKLDGSFQSSIMAMILSMCAQMERELTAERVKKGMKTDKCIRNMKTRKPRTKNKLDGKEDEIKRLLAEGIRRPVIATQLGVHNAQLHKFIRDKITPQNVQENP